MHEKIINGSNILITGGTGSFGGELVSKLLSCYSPNKIIIFSRDEKKQHEMRIEFENNDKLKFIIGDIRNRTSVFKAVKGVDYIFHAAALKHVPICEFFPYEAVETNITGAYNVLDAADEYCVKKIVVLSTDKAVYPINAMGMTKAVMEKLMLAKARESSSGTVFCGVRYGNVMYSRGSVIPLFVDQIKNNKQLTITNGDMTRFLLPLPVAIELVLFALDEGENGDILVRKSPAATIRDVADGMCELFQYKEGVREIGIREGEKMHETLVTQEELCKAVDYKDYYRVKHLSSTDYEQYLSDGTANTFPEEGYTSDNTQRLSLTETKDLLSSLEEITDA